MTQSLTLHELNASKSKKRINFDDLFDERKTLIEKMSLKEIRTYREELKSWLENVEELSKEEGITEGRKKYLRGLRKVIINLLNHSKKRIKLMNMVVCNGTTINHALRFIRHAAEILPHETFQILYGLSVSNEEKEKTTIEEIKHFMEECQNKR